METHIDFDGHTYTLLEIHILCLKYIFTYDGNKYFLFLWKYVFTFDGTRYLLLLEIHINF